MQAVESQSLILYHSDLRGQWPEEAAAALALRALTELGGRQVGAGELAFPDGGKPRLAHPAAEGFVGPDFSIAHSGHWVGCAAVAHGRVGFDVEVGTTERITEWTAREAALKACGLGLAAAREVELDDGRAVCRGVMLNAWPLELFAGAAACVMTTAPVARLAARALTLAELFAA